MILKGTVVSGLGVAKKFINMISNTFYDKTGVKLYPGTLNIKLDKPYNLKIDFIIKAEEYGGDFNVQIQKCKILGNNAYIVRSEKNVDGKGDYKQDIIEIISNIKFRENYNLNNEKEIKIYV